MSRDIKNKSYKIVIYYFKLITVLFIFKIYLSILHLLIKDLE